MHVTSQVIPIMKKQPTTQRKPRPNLTPDDSASRQSPSLLLRDVPPLRKSSKPDSIADSELDRPVEGVDPTLPFNSAVGAPGHKTKEPQLDDENEDGESVVEQLAEEGAERAEENTARQGLRKSSGRA